MKQKFNFFRILAVLAFFSVFYSCQDDEALIVKENISYQIKTSQVSINQVINEINNPEIKKSLKGIKQINSLSNSLLRSNSELFFIKKEKEGLLTTYILNINSYSQQKPYFLKFIITKNLNETERFGYIKYIPTNPTTELDLNTFTGEVQLLNDLLEVYGTAHYINGIKQESNQNTSTNRTCNTEIVVTEIKCSHSGQHGVGESCNEGYINDAYYLITFFTSCTGKGTEPVQIIEDTGSGSQDGGGSYPASIFLNPFLATLSQEELDIYNANPSIQEYLVKNLVSVPNPNYNPQIGGDPTIIIIEPEAEQFVNELIDLAIAEPNQNDVNNLISLTILIEESDNQFFTEEFAESLVQHTDLDISTLPPDYPLSFLSLKTFFNYRKLRQLNPEWSRAKCIWHASKEIVHISLDAFGLIPVVGEVADLTNGLIYAIEGDTINATLSVASAIPFVGYGSTATKYGVKIINSASTITTKVKLVWKVTANGIEFGSSNQLRKVLGITSGSFQAHHIIPWAHRTNPVVQKAAKSGSAFHMNEELNGIALSTAIHMGSHPTYSAKILQRLTVFNNNFPNATPQQCYDEISDIINDVRTAIQNNPNTPINQLNF